MSLDFFSIADLYSSPLVLLCSRCQPWDTSQRTICRVDSMAQICQIDSSGTNLPPSPKAHVKESESGEVVFFLHPAPIFFSLWIGGKSSERKLPDRKWMIEATWGHGGNQVIILKPGILLVTDPCQIFCWNFLLKFIKFLKKLWFIPQKFNFPLEVIIYSSSDLSIR